MDTKKQLNDFLAYYDQQPMQDVFIKGRRAYLVPKEVQKVVDEVKLDSFSAGLPLGEASIQGFRPSFTLLDMISTTNHVIINDDAGKKSVGAVVVHAPKGHDYLCPVPSLGILKVLDQCTHRPRVSQLSEGLRSRGRHGFHGFDQGINGIRRSDFSQ